LPLKALNPGPGFSSSTVPDDATFPLFVLYGFDLAPPEIDLFLAPPPN